MTCSAQLDKNNKKACSEHELFYQRNRIKIHRMLYLNREFLLRRLRNKGTFRLSEDAAAQCKSQHSHEPPTSSKAMRSLQSQATFFQ
jgi:hypothetical protein